MHTHIHTHMGPPRLLPKSFTEIWRLKTHLCSPSEVSEYVYHLYYIIFTFCMMVDSNNSSIWFNLGENRVVVKVTTNVKISKSLFHSQFFLRFVFKLQNNTPGLVGRKDLGWLSIWFIVSPMFMSLLGISVLLMSLGWNNHKWSIKYYWLKIIKF